MGFPCFLRLHDFPNSFAFAANLDHDGKTQPIGNSPTLFVRIQSCTDPERTLPVLVRGSTTNRFTHILINRYMAEFASFLENEEVILHAIQPGPATSIELAPVGSDDYSLVDSNQNTVEETFLNQCTVLRTGMMIPFFAGKGRPVLFKVVSVMPRTHKEVFVERFAELHIVAGVQDVSSTKQWNGNPNDVFGSRKSSIDGAERASRVLERVSDSNNAVDFLSPTKFTLNLRILPTELCRDTREASAGYEIFAINTDVIERQPHHYFVFFRSSNSKVHAGVLHLLPQVYTTADARKGIHDVLTKFPGHCLASANFPVGDYESIEVSSVPLQRCRQLKAINVSDEVLKVTEEPTTSSEKLSKQIQDISRHSQLVMSSTGVAVNVFDISSPSTSFLLVPSEEDISASPGDGTPICYHFKNTVVNLKESADQKPDKTEKQTPSKQSDKLSNYAFENIQESHNFRFQSKIVKEASDWTYWMRQTLDSDGHGLILGPDYSGRTTILQNIAKRIVENNAVFCRRIDCAMWDGDPGDEIAKHLKEELTHAEKKAPSVIFLDGLDLIADPPEDEHRNVSIERIFEVILRFFRSCSPNVKVISTARSLRNLYPILLGEGGGNKPFTEVWEIPNLELEDRLDIIEQFCGFRSELAAKETENLNVFELKKFCNHLRWASTFERSAEDAKNAINEDDIRSALDKFRPSRGPSALADFTGTMADVGGMHTQKQALEEMFLWPKMHPEMFSKSSLPVGKGILLFGPSGCGKTLLAKSFCATHKFSVIFVKGPELLSKYIGSSEENVRNVFARARSSSPCVIIFDELDSLAPKRGSDSTGVTDRVVNQLLTEMDGAEGSHGVFVIGCTSRIDLIDSALMRPGRMDIKLKCGRPNMKDRAEILEIYSGKVRTAELGISEMTSLTKGWTGADLYGWMTEAQFHAQRRVNREKENDGEVVVNMTDFLSTIEDSRPKKRGDQVKIFKAGQREQQQQRVTLA